MNKTKKITVLLLLISLFMSLGNGVYSADTSTEPVKSELMYEDNIALLKAMGVWSDANASADGTVTRANLVSVAVAMMGASNNQPKEISLFTDVPLTNKNAAAIYAARSLDLISGYSDNTFRPNEVISTGQLNKVMVNLLGHSVKIDSLGGYETGYNRIARDEGIYNNVTVSDSAKIKNHEFAQVVVNVLNTDVAVHTTYGDTDSWTVSHGETVLSHYLKISKYSGMVTGNEYSSFIQNGGVAKGKILIDDKIYTYKGDSSQLIGLNVDYYIKNNDKDVIIYLNENKYNDTQVIMLDMIKSAGRLSNQDIVVEYYLDSEKNKTKEITVKAAAFEIFNHKVKNLDVKDFLLKNGELKINDTDKDRKYDIVNITFYIDYVVDSIKSGVIYDKYNKPYIDIAPDTKTISLSIMRGTKKFYIEDVREYDVLSIAADTVKWDLSGNVTIDTVNSEIYKIQVSTKDLSGRIDEITEDSVRVGEEVADLSEDFKKLVANGTIKDFGVNSRAVLCLNQYGRVAGVEVAYDSKLAYGYCSGYELKTGINQSLAIKVFDWNGFVKHLTFAKNVTVDGQMTRGLTALSSKITSGIIGTVVGYKINADGQISWIDTTQYNPSSEILDESMRDFTTRNDIEYRIGNYTFNNEFSVNKNTIVFIVPNDITRDDLYSVERQSYFRSNGKYDIEAYNFSKANVAEFVVVKTAGATALTYDSDVAFYNRIYRAVDENGEPVDVMSVYLRGEEKEYILSDSINGVEYDITRPTDGSQPVVTTRTISVSNLVKGDIIRYSLDGEARMNNFERKVPISKRNTPDLGMSTEVPGEVSSYGKNVHFVLGYPYAIDDNILALDTNETTRRNIVAYNDRITLYDRETKKFEKITYDQIVTYEMANDYSGTPLVFAQLNNQYATTQIFVIK